MSFTTRQGRAFYKRPLAVLGATALTVGAFGPAAQADSHVQSIAPACEGWTDPFGFEDIENETQAYQDAINCLAWYDVTRGRNATTYAPDDEVKRYEMALFISRTLGYVERSSDIDVVDPEEAEDAGFEDVDGLTGPQQDAIDQLVELEIVQGKNADEFAPYEPITRRDMARFIDRMADALTTDTDLYEADYTDLFPDVPQTLPGAEDIYSLRAEGIVQGETSGLYLPYADVDRKDMAFYIMRTVADLIEKDLIAALPMPGNQTYTVTGGGETVEEGSDVTYSATGIEADEVTITLAEAANVTTDEDGNTVFATDDDGATDFGTVAAEIIEVNGIVLSEPTDSWTGAPAADGTLTFTVGGAVDAEESVVPVVFADADEDGTVDSDEEPFGVGDATTFATVEAIVLEPTTGQRAFGSNHTVTAQLVTDTAVDDSFNAAPYAGETIVFQITREFFEGTESTGTTTLTATATTDEEGEATYTWSVADPNAETGDSVEDTVTAFHDADSDGVLDTGEAVDTGDATVTWSDAAGIPDDLVTSPAGDGTEAIDEVNLVGTSQTLTATVTDQYGDPVAGETVTFTIGALTYTRTTNENGVATLTYQGPSTATPAQVVIISAGDSLTETLQIQWAEGVATVDGVDYATLQDAVDNADPDDTITAVGDFAETVSITTDGVTLQGDGAELTGGFYLTGAADDVTIDGFDVTVTETQGVEIENTVDGLTVSNNTLTAGTGATTGIFLNQTDGTVVEGNTIEGFTAGVATDTTGDVTIEGNTFVDNDEGIGVGGPNVTIVGNTFTTDDETDAYVRAYLPVSTAYLQAVLAGNTYDPAAEIDTEDADGAIVPVTDEEV